MRPRAHVLALMVVLAAGGTARADRAEAEKIAAEARKLFASDKPKAEELWGRVIDADPTFADWWANRGAVRYYQLKWDPALQDFARALELNAAAKPGDPTTERDVRAMRENIYYDFGQLRQALEDVEWVIRFDPGTRGIQAEYAKILLAFGQVDDAQREIDKAPPADVSAAQLRPTIPLLKGDWAAAEAEARKGLPAGGAELCHFAIVVSLCERGKKEEAVRYAQSQFSNPLNAGGQLIFAYIMGTPGWGGLDVDDVKARAKSIRDSVGEWSTVTEVEGRALVLAGRFDEAVSVLESRAPRASFEVLFWKGSALWKLGKPAEARMAFLQARRVNPFLLAHASRIDGLKEFLEPIDREGAEEAKGSDPIHVIGQQETLLFSVNEFEDLALACRFAQAASEYKKLSELFSSPLRKAQAAERAAELGDAAAVVKRLQTAAAGRSPALKVRVRGLDVALKSASDDGIEFEVKGGTGKLPWAGISASDFASLADAVSPKPAELLALGVILWERGDVAVGGRLLDAAARKDAKLAQRKDAAVSRLRGVAVPEGGFVYVKDAWLTPEEKTNFDKGQVRFGGQWMAKADRDQLAKGLVKKDGKWTEQPDEELKKNGFRKYKDEWLAPEDYSAKRSKWEDAWEEETPHYKIRSNAGEAFVHDLADVAEAAYAELKEFYGKEPKLGTGKKMILYAFKDFEEYRNYCVENDAEGMIAAGGYARSSSDQVVGWNKQKDTAMFLQTMIHEASHLYFFKCGASPLVPSWYAEGMATYFEGFRHKGGRWKFDHRPLTRVACIRDAVQRGKHIPLSELPGLDAGRLIATDATKAILFYSEVWALTYFLSQTDNGTYRDAYARYRKSADAGGRDPLSKFIPDTGKLEKDFVAFVRGL